MYSVLSLFFCGLLYTLWKSLFDEAREKFFRLKASGERSSWLWHLGNCRLYFAIFNLSLQDGNVFFHYIFVYFQGD